MIHGRGGELRAGGGVARGMTDESQQSEATRSLALPAPRMRALVSQELARQEGPVLDTGGKVAATLAWIVWSGVPLLFLMVLEIPLYPGRPITMNGFFPWMLWALCAGLSMPVYLRLLGHVGTVMALPPPTRPLPHLPPGGARLVDEVAAIRAELDGGDVEVALQRAWELTNEVERAPVELRGFVEQAGATLQPVRELLASRAAGKRARLAPAGVRERLGQTLAAFETALCEPRGVKYRG